ncbi:hypothetical protein GGI07_000092 [Coemansia sp. Benny D115]|nr:hypothetical protein GGI07_000092 [Coemansia sp. Benny D115]
MIGFTISSVYSIFNKLLVIIRDWIFATGWVVVGPRLAERVDTYKEIIWPRINGNVLEIGPGFAESLRFLPRATLKDGSEVVDPKIITSYTIVEPNAFMFEKMQQNAERYGFNVRYDTMSFPEGAKIVTKAGSSEMATFNIVKGTLDYVDDIPEAVLKNAPYDSIAASSALCTVGNLEVTLQNIFKLLRPGGTFYFIEHVRHPEHNHPSVIEENGVNAWLWGKIQDWVTPAWKVFVGYGCHLNRRTGEVIASMDGWKTVEYKSVRVSGHLEANILPMSFGTAVKPAN